MVSFCSYFWCGRIFASMRLSLVYFSPRLYLVLTHVMRRPCWCTKQWQYAAQVLHNNRIKLPKVFFGYCSLHEHGRRDVTWKARIVIVNARLLLKFEEPFLDVSRQSF